MLLPRIILIAVYALGFCVVLFVLQRLAKKYTWKKNNVGDFYFFLAFATAVIQKDAPYFSFNKTEITIAVLGSLAYIMGALGIVKIKLKPTLLLLLSLVIMVLSLLYGEEIFMSIVMLAAWSGLLLFFRGKAGSYVGFGASLLVAFVLVLLSFQLVVNLLELI